MHRAAMAYGCPRLIPLGWLIWRSPSRTETVEAIIGKVEIRSLPAGHVVETRMKGEQARAVHTGTRRLVRYASGENVAGAAPGTFLPITQRQTLSGRWLVGLYLQPTGGGAPAPLSPKITVVARDASWVATVRVPARSIDAALRLGGATILEAITGSQWLAAGPPTLRLYCGVRWPWSRWEIAVPLTRGETFRA